MGWAACPCVLEMEWCDGSQEMPSARRGEGGLLGPAAGFLRVLWALVPYVRMSDAGCRRLREWGLFGHGKDGWWRR